jgi:hypothetical protein
MHYAPSGADDQKPTRTPAAWMISLAAPLALRQRLFFVRVTLTSRIGQLLASSEESMGSEERLAVSERMKHYWASRNRT